MTAPTAAAGPGEPSRLESVALHTLAAALVLQAVQRPWALSLAGKPLLLADVTFVIAFGLTLAAGPVVWRRLWAPSVVGPLAAYAVAMAASVPGSLEPRTSAKKLVLMGSMCALTACVAALGRSPAARRTLARAIILGGLVTTAVSLLAVVGFGLGVRDRGLNLGLSVYGSLPPGPYPRVRGLFENMNQACSHLALGFALLAAGIGPALRPLRRVAMAVAMAVAGLFTFSVAYAGVLVAAADALARLARGAADGGRRVLAAGLRGVAGLGLLGAGLLLLTVFVPTSGGESIRLRIFREAFGTFTAHPWFGAGVGTSPVDVHWVNPSGVAEHLGEAHNVVLSLLAQEGVVGLLGYAVFVGAAMRAAVHAARGDTPDARLARGVVLGIVGCLVLAGVGAAIEDARHVVVALGLGLAWAPVSARPPSPR